MFKRSANGEGMVYDPNDNTIPMKKALWPQKTWFYERLFFEMVSVMIKDLKQYCIKDTISIKISFMH